MNREKILKDLYALKDEGYRQFHKGLVPGEEKLIGVRVPDVRKYAVQLVRGSGLSVPELINAAGDEYYEEIMLQGMLIGIQKDPDTEMLLSQITGFVPKIRNWGICDVFCAGLKHTAAIREEMFSYLRKYLYSSREFSVRFGIVMLLDHFLDDDHIDEVLRITGEISHSGYYAKMAQAWLISCAYVKYPDKTESFMKDCSLDRFTYRKALQKTLESRRVSDEKKERIRAVMRKDH